jgi:DNA polymerase-4
VVACFLFAGIAIACERARLTHLWGEPVALVDDAGLLAVVSEEAAAYGIAAGQKQAGARALCERLTVLPYDRCCYELAAQCIWDLLAIESSVVEPASPEICYVEMSGLRIVERIQELTLLIASRVRIPVRVGLAASKLVAREAALQDRGEEVLVDARNGLAAMLLASVPLERLPQISYPVRQRLIRRGVHTLGDVRKLPARELTRQFHDVGLLIRRLAFGEDGDRVRPLWPPRSIEHGLAFDDETGDAARIHEALRRCAGAIAKRLADGQEYCRTLTLQVSVADGSRLSEMEKLSLPASGREQIERAALRLLRRIPLDRPLLGVCLRAADLGAGGGLQLALMDGSDGKGLPHERRRRLDATLLFLRKRYGVGAVVTAAMLRQARRIDLWTYPLGHLLNEPVQVATDARGRPVRYWRRGSPRTITRVQNCWREAEWFWGSLSEKTIYRVETAPSGLSELHQLGVTWRLGAMAD